MTILHTGARVTAVSDTNHEVRLHGISEPAYAKGIEISDGTNLSVDIDQCTPLIANMRHSVVQHPHTERIYVVRDNKAVEIIVPDVTESIQPIFIEEFGHRCSILGVTIPELDYTVADIDELVIDWSKIPAISYEGKTMGGQMASISIDPDDFKNDPDKIKEHIEETINGIKTFVIDQIEEQTNKATKWSYKGQAVMLYVIASTFPGNNDDGTKFGGSLQSFPIGFIEGEVTNPQDISTASTKSLYSCDIEIVNVDGTIGKVAPFDIINAASQLGNIHNNILQVITTLIGDDSIYYRFFI